MTRISVLRALPIALAAMGLIGSLIAAFWLLSAAPSADGVADPESLRAVERYETYGGDAYTGIQNAAVDTEVAVVEGANAEMRQARVNVATQLDQADEQWRHLYAGLAILVVALGVATFTMTLQCYLRPLSLVRTPNA